MVRFHGLVPSDNLNNESIFGEDFTTGTKMSANEGDKIHSLYQDLYLTDLKNDLGDATESIQRERESNML
jgi:hypothetical protein